MKSRALRHLSSILIGALTMSLSLATVLRVKFKKLGKQDSHVRQDRQRRAKRAAPLLEQPRYMDDERHPQRSPLAFAELGCVQTRHWHPGSHRPWEMKLRVKFSTQLCLFIALFCRGQAGSIPRRSRTQMEQPQH